MKGNEWGQSVLTNVGSLGITEGFAPIPPFLHCMFLFCTGKAENRAVVINDKIEIRYMMTCIVTVDHRYGDAGLALKFLRIIKDYVEDPEGFDNDKYEESKPYSEVAATG